MNCVYSTYTMQNLFHSVMLPSWHQVHLQAKEKVSLPTRTWKCRQNARLCWFSTCIFQWSFLCCEWITLSSSVVTHWGTTISTNFSCNLERQTRLDETISVWRLTNMQVFMTFNNTVISKWHLTIFSKYNCDLIKKKIISLKVLL